MLPGRRAADQIYVLPDIWRYGNEVLIRLLKVFGDKSLRAIYLARHVEKIQGTNLEF